MIYNDVCGDSLSRLGFGLMRLPTLPDGQIDEALFAKMVEYALANGVNYFDTAYVYHCGWSEVMAGRVLSRYPRDSYRLASKFPGHQVSQEHYPEAIFEEQLKRCQTDHFDYYLLHNVCENSYETYMNPKWGIAKFFEEQRKNGRIRHLGFSCHAQPPMLERFVDEIGIPMEFCQIQLNYLDWTLQDAKRKYDFLTKRGIPVWVMEPVRGGKLATLPASLMEDLEAKRPGASAASWGFRWIQNLPNVKMILSGMSNPAQLEDNVRTFSEGAPLDDSEWQLMLDIAEKLKDSVPCTACRYCVDGCPQKLDIPRLIRIYNDIRFQKSMMVGMELDSLPPEKRPDACLGCGACMEICPQKIEIPVVLRDFVERLKEVPKWADVCKAREAGKPKI